MRTYFRSLAEVLESPLASVAKAFSRTAGQNRVLKSTKLEDMIYQDLRRGDTTPPGKSCPPFRRSAETFTKAFTP